MNAVRNTLIILRTIGIDFAFVGVRQADAPRPVRSTVIIGQAFRIGRTFVAGLARTHIAVKICRASGVIHTEPDTGLTFLPVINLFARLAPGAIGRNVACAGPLACVRMGSDRAPVIKVAVGVNHAGIRRNPALIPVSRVDADLWRFAVAGDATLIYRNTDVGTAGPDLAIKAKTTFGIKITFVRDPDTDLPVFTVLTKVVGRTIFIGRTFVSDLTELQTAWLCHTGHSKGAAGITYALVGLQTTDVPV